MAQTLILSLFDISLCIGLLWLAWRMLRCATLFEAVVLFISFGLLMALSWVRLKAPDVALAEAAIGAGVSGALLLSALRHLESGQGNELTEGPLPWGIWILAVVVLLPLLWIVFHLPAPQGEVAGQVAARLPESGVSNPVTAVLLNFRGYDTLLEVMVLLVAALTVWGLGKPPYSLAIVDEPMLRSAVRLLLPMMLLTSLYLLWIGASKPGGAFQAGAVAASMGLLWLMSGETLFPSMKDLPWRMLLIVGPLLFAGSALLMFAMQNSLLEYPSSWAGQWMLLIEAAALLSIATIIVVLFRGGSR